VTSQSRFAKCPLKKRRALVVIRVLLLLTFAMAVSSYGPPATPSDTGYRLVKSLVFKASSTNTPWYVSAYQADVSDLTVGELPAKLCFSSRALDLQPDCVVAEAHSGVARYAFQGVETLSVEHILNDGESAVLFVARFSGGGSGALRLVSLWGAAGAQTGLRRMLLQVMSEQSEYEILPMTKNGHVGVFVTADYELSLGETHFSSHHFIVRIFRLGSDRSAFASIDSYTTARRYPSLDDTDRIDVISYEMAEIEKRLDRSRK